MADQSSYQNEGAFQALMFGKQKWRESQNVKKSMINVSHLSFAQAAGVGASAACDQPVDCLERVLGDCLKYKGVQDRSGWHASVELKGSFVCSTTRPATSYAEAKNFAALQALCVNNIIDAKSTAELAYPYRSAAHAYFMAVPEAPSVADVAVDPVEKLEELLRQQHRDWVIQYEQKLTPGGWNAEIFIRRPQEHDLKPEPVRQKSHKVTIRQKSHFVTFRHIQVFELGKTPRIAQKYAATAALCQLRTLLQFPDLEKLEPPFNKQAAVLLAKIENYHAEQKEAKKKEREAKKKEKWSTVGKAKKGSFREQDFDDACSVNTSFTCDTVDIDLHETHHFLDRSQERNITTLEQQRALKYGKKSLLRNNNVAFDSPEGVRVIKSGAGRGDAAITTYADERLEW
jgi:hypothetical protein